MTVSSTWRSSHSSAARSHAPPRPPSSTRPSTCTTRTRTGASPGPSSTTCSTALG
ncbi:unnamed protein product [Linum tenue]|uniref:Uncharacterized protein n=1 Tax=Linum tenue TaxID=586396 RepID=A0AAV0RQ74_9ROSI|nr:unnamed protein product [Linum tenue]